jgi:hypothetical protein
MSEQASQIPNGLDHIALLEKVGRMTAAQTVPLFDKNELKAVGISLNILYQAATCHRKCHGGNHLLERLCGRAYNLAAEHFICSCSAFMMRRSVS